MKFLVIFMQEGEGCDYTIGCGTRVVAIEAVSLEAAALHVSRLDENAPAGSLGDLGAHEGGEREMRSVLIVPADNVLPLDLTAVYGQERARKKREEEEAKDAIDRENYERLKRKYEGGS